MDNIINSCARCYTPCPECSNPLKIIGMRKQTGEFVRLYQKDITDRFCYIRLSKQRFIKRKPKGGMAESALRIMKSQFDRVIYVLSEDMEIQISIDLAKEMLKHFICHKAWEYGMASLSNLPWVLANTQPSTSLYGQWFLRDSELRRAIEKHCPAALFKDTGSSLYVQLKHRPSEYLNVRCFFFNHVKSLIADGAHLNETIDFEVESDLISIYRKTILIRTDYFRDLTKLPNDQNRDSRLLQVADDLIDV